MTQTQIAPYFNVKQGAYCAWENGTREPDLSTLCRVAKYFGISTDALLGNKPVAEQRQDTERVKSLRSRISTLRETTKSVSENAEVLLRSIDELEGAL